jgi:tight adherence protein C
MFVSLLVVAAALAFAPTAAATLEQRLMEVAGSRRAAIKVPTPKTSFTDVMTKLGSFAPQSPAEMGKLKRRLVCAGYRQTYAVSVFIGIRVGVGAVCFLIAVTPLVGRPSLPLALSVAALGYVLPGMVLARLAKRRQHRIRLQLPDALDLLVVSVEAGLGLDQALQRVGDEIAFAHPDLSEELRLINLELRAGTAREDALKNLADRTEVDDLASLVAMLIQTDKFGTSVAQALRVHSDTLRTKRRQRAEEAAAKTGVKMVFPLVCCIFPAIWVVTIGPAAIKIIQVLFPLAIAQ